MLFQCEHVDLCIRNFEKEKIENWIPMKWQYFWNRVDNWLTRSPLLDYFFGDTTDRIGFCRNNKHNNKTTKKLKIILKYDFVLCKIKENKFQTKAKIERRNQLSHSIFFLLMS